MAEGRAKTSLVRRIVKSVLRKGRGLRRSQIVGHVDIANEDLIQGWVYDRANVDRAVALDLVHGGEIIAKGRANAPRPDLAQAGHGRMLSGFRIPLPSGHDFRTNDRVEIRDALTGRAILDSPIRIEPNPAVRCFRTRTRSLDPAHLSRFQRRYGEEGIGFSIVMPVYDPPREWLVEAIESVRAQWHGRWELICVDDCSPAPHVAEVLAHYAALDPRIKPIRTARNGGISAATNAGIAAAAHDYLGFMDHDDALEPTALLAMARVLRDGEVDLAYSDEILTGEDIDRFIQFVARPAFSYDYYLSHPYFVHFVVCRTALARSVGGLDETLAVSQDVDFVLRLLERTGRVAHVPQFLYRWRTHEGSTGHSKAHLVTANTCGAIDRSLARLYPGCRVEAGSTFNTYRVAWPAARGRTLIVIPTKNALSYLRVAIDSIERHTDRDAYELVVVDHESDDPATRAYLATLRDRYAIEPYAGRFNFSRMNNVAARAHGAACEFLLFLNNDIEIVSAGWLGRLASLAARPDVGAVGPMLTYGDGLVQHGGVILGFNGAAEHVLKMAASRYGEARNPGYNATLTATRDFSAVTAACLMTRRAVFEEVGGFDERLDIGFNDTDLCLRIRERGYKVLYDGDLIVKHHESATRNTAAQLLKHPENTALFKERWQALIRDGDPFYSPMLSLEGSDHALRRDRPPTRQLRPRIGEVGFRVRPPG